MGPFGLSSNCLTSCVYASAHCWWSTKADFHLITIRRFFSPKDENLRVLMSIVCTVYVGGWVGVGACTAAEGRRSGRIGRRAARRPSYVLYPAPIPSSCTPVRILSTQTFRVTGVWTLSTQTLRLAGVWILYTNFQRRKLWGRS